MDLCNSLCLLKANAFLLLFLFSSICLCLKKKQNNCNIKAEKFNHGSREKTNNRNKLAKYPEVVEIVQFGRGDVVIPTRMVERVKNFI